jgi:hypothetical protein
VTGLLTGLIGSDGRGCPGNGMSIDSKVIYSRACQAQGAMTKQLALRLDHLLFVVAGRDHVHAGEGHIRRS